MNKKKSLTYSQVRDAENFKNEAKDNLCEAAKEYIVLGDWRQAVECAIMAHAIDECVPFGNLTPELVEAAIVAKLPEEFKNEELHKLPIAVWRYLKEDGKARQLHSALPSEKDVLEVAALVIKSAGKSDILSADIFVFYEPDMQIEVYDDGSVFDEGSVKIYKTPSDFSFANPIIYKDFVFPPREDLKRFLEKYNILKPTEEISFSPGIDFVRYEDRAFLISEDRNGNAVYRADFIKEFSGWRAYSAEGVPFVFRDKDTLFWGMDEIRQLRMNFDLGQKGEFVEPPIEVVNAVFEKLKIDTNNIPPTASKGIGI